MRRVALVGLLLACPACVTAGELSQRLDTWVGANTDTVVAAWGAPSGTYVAADGSAVLTYRRLGVQGVGAYEAENTYTYHCRVDFRVDRERRVVGARWTGDTQECDETILGLSH